MENRASLSLTGVQKIDNISPKVISCNVLNCGLIIEGEGMEVKKLDVEAGVIEIIGTINSLRYTGEKKNILKRLFK